MSSRFYCGLIAVHTLAIGLWSQSGQAGCPIRSQQTHMSNCRTIGGTYQFSNGQLLNNGTSPGNVICPITQIAGDRDVGRTQSVVLDGWANPGGTTVQACVTWYDGGGVGGSCGTAQNFSNQVYHANLAIPSVSWPGGFPYLFIYTPGIAAGSLNSLFGYRYTVSSTSPCPPG